MKAALITGSTKGIGLEIAKQLAELGFHVWLSGRNTVAGKKAADKLNKSGLKADFVTLDIANRDSIVKAHDIISTECRVLDVLVNNAAIQLDSSMNILEIPAEIVDEMFRTNLFGAIFVTQIFSPLLKTGSRVINVSSAGGQLTTGMGDWAPLYCISKAALNGLTIQLAYAMKAKGVAVNSVSPGWVRTDMGGSMAPRSVQQGAETPVWLATAAPIAHTGLYWQDKKIAPW